MRESSRQQLGEEPLVPPGEGPFRIKGNGYLGHMKWVTQDYPGGAAAYFDALSPKMRAFFEQSFLAMSFFDLMPLVCVGHTCARATKMSFFDFIAHRSRIQAEQDLNGIYRALLRLSSPRLVAMRVPTIMAQYFDFGAARIIESEPHHIRFEANGIPLIFAEWFHAAYDGFGEVIVKATGGVAPNLELEQKDVLGAVQGYPTTRMRFLLQWS